MTSAAWEKLRRAEQLAKGALEAAVEHRWGDAAEQTNQINQECGVAGVAVGLATWVDQLVEHSADGKPMPHVGQVSTVHCDSGRLEDRPTPEQVWANSIVAARANGDWPAFRGLVEDLIVVGDPRRQARYVGAVLLSVAETIRSLPRGYALIGLDEV